MKKKWLSNRFAERMLLLMIRMVFSYTRVFKFVPAHTDYPKGSVRKVTRKGIRYELDISDYQEWLIYFYCKTDSSDYVLEYLGRSEIILDIGANVGQTAFNMFTKQSKKGLRPRIYAFEPFPSTFEKLKTNLGLNKQIKGIIPFNKGVSSHQGILHMSHDAANSGAFQMTNDREHGLPVPVTSLDEFVSAQGIAQVDFIKIDVEGHELLVLEGAMTLIRRNKPVIVFEYSIENIQVHGGNLAGTLEMLRDLGYDLFTKEGLSDLDAILRLPFQTDLICIPKQP